MFFRALRPDDLLKHMLSLAERYRELISAHGIRTRPRGDGWDPTLFERLSLTEKHAILDRLIANLETLDELRSRGGRITDSPDLLRIFLKRKGWKACGDVIERIEKDDAIVIYDSRDRHVFQNARFLEQAGVGLERLFCQPWYESSPRPDAIQRRLGELNEGFRNGTLRETLIDPVAGIRILSPVLHGDQPVATLVALTL